MTRGAGALVTLAVVLPASFVPQVPNPGRAPGAGTIHGRVEFVAPPPLSQPRPGIADLGLASAPKAQGERRAVVYLENAPIAAFEPAPQGRRATMDQRNETFVPHVLAVCAGAVVDFPNSDPFFHNVFSLSKAKRFDLGRYASGRSKSVRFDEPGIVRVFCDIHSHMNAFILVFAHPYFAVTDEQGRYRIEGVPAGAYSVAAWYEGTVRASRSTVMPADGGGVRVDFSVR